MSLLPRRSLERGAASTDSETYKLVRSSADLALVVEMEGCVFSEQSGVTRRMRSSSGGSPTSSTARTRPTHAGIREQAKAVAAALACALV